MHQYSQRIWFNTVRFGVLSLLATAIVLGGCSKKPTPPKLEYGSLGITSEPTSAAIWLDGKDSELVTPDTLHGLAVGRHDFQLKLSSFADWMESVEIRSGTLSSIHAQLVRHAGSLAVSSEPTGARIFLDGTDTYRTTPVTFTTVAVGHHEILLQFPGYFDFRQNVTISDGDTTAINAVLVRATGKVVIFSSPDHARIFLDGLDTDHFTPDTLASVAPGNHVIRLFFAGRFPFEKEASVIAGQVTLVDARMDPAPQYTLACVIEDTLFTIGLDGLNPRILATDCRYRSRVRSSPDGELITYAAKNELKILNRNGSLRASLPWDFFPGTLAPDFSWSNSGLSEVHGDYANGIYKYDRATNRFEKIYNTSSNRYDHNPVFAPNDSVIAFTHHRYGRLMWLQCMDADGRNARTISDTLGTLWDELVDLQWISSSKLIFKVGLSGVYTFDLPTRFLERVLEGIGVNRLELSPDRSKFVIARGGLFVGTVNDWTTREYLAGSIPDLAWSPNGEALAFVTYDGFWWLKLDGTRYHIVDVRRGFSFRRSVWVFR